MSSNLECQFFSADNRWYYVLENYNAPQEAWDWRDYATVYGPFNSEDAAHSHLSANHANPGGYSVSADVDPSNATYKELIGRAVSPNASRGRRSPFRSY